MNIVMSNTHSIVNDVLKGKKWFIFGFVQTVLVEMAALHKVGVI